MELLPHLTCLGRLAKGVGRCGSWVAKASLRRSPLGRAGGIPCWVPGLGVLPTTARGVSRHARKGLAALRGIAGRSAARRRATSRHRGAVLLQLLQERTGHGELR